MVFPDAIRTPFSSLWPLRGSEEASLGDTPDTHGAMFSPCSELLRSLARQFYSAAILQRHSSKIVLFLQCIEPVMSWEHCIDHSTTSARLSQLGFHLQPRDREESFLPLQQRQTRTAKTQVVSAQRLQLWQPKLRSDDLQPKSDYQDKNTHPSPLKGATHVSLPLASCSIFRAPQRVCHGSRRALQVNCPEIPPYLGLMFEPSAHCPDCRKSILFFFCFFQRPTCLGLVIFSWFLTCDRFTQLLVILVHGFPF